MPIYEYQCQTCGKRTEVLQRMDEAPLAACPECGGEVKKLLSAPAFQFKGSGWYVTDYAGKKEGKTDSKGADAKADATETKTEAKSDKPAESAKETKAAPAPAGASSGSD